MRFLLFALVLPLASCGFDCNFPDYVTVEERQTLRAEPAVADTLTVVFGAEEYSFYFLRDVWVRLGAETPGVSASGDVRLLMDVEFGAHGAETVPPLQSIVAGDTVFVDLGTEGLKLAQAPPCASGDGIIQPVCSPGESTYQVFVNGAEAPEGVRTIRYLWRDGAGFLVPIPHAGPETSAQRPHSPRTVRG